MIRFYCLQNRGSSMLLMAKVTMNSHASALYSLTVIQFNGSGDMKNDKDLRAGVMLCPHVAFLGHIDALQELGHCLQDGYNIKQNAMEGRRFLVQANVHELTVVPFTENNKVSLANMDPPTCSQPKAQVSNQVGLSNVK
ncbi:hypothetical protein JHK87_018100 [Glycine soja]|nr:hypothetical protein JHK87_018100 [Glycine soja]